MLLRYKIQDFKQHFNGQASIAQCCSLGFKSRARHLRERMDKTGRLGGSPGLMVMGRDPRLACRGFDRSNWCLNKFCHYN